ncbi:MAG: DinB family protein [Dehalococcoidia bacterium]
MTMPATESERIRSYLIAQANKLSIPDLVQKVRDDSAALQQAGEAVNPARFNDRPAEGEWSAAEVWTHVLEMSEHGAAAITGILDTGSVPPRVRDEISGKTREGLKDTGAYWKAYLAIREPLYERVSRAVGDEHLDVKINHPMFGDFSWREWLLFMRVHDLDHMRQLQSIAAALS